MVTVSCQAYVVQPPPPSSGPSGVTIGIIVGCVVGGVVVVGVLAVAAITWRNRRRVRRQGNRASAGSAR